jgi:hypothetical protein
MDFSYTFASGGRALALATEVYFVAANADGELPAAWLPDECVTDMLPSTSILSLTDYKTIKKS